MCLRTVYLEIVERLLSFLYLSTYSENEPIVQCHPNSELAVFSNEFDLFISQKESGNTEPVISCYCYAIGNYYIEDFIYLV